MPSIAEVIAAKRAAQASAEAAKLFPAELAIALVLKLNPNDHAVVDSLSLFLDWLGPFAKPVPSQSFPEWRWVSSWKTLSIAQRMKLPHKTVCCVVLTQILTKPEQ